ncbi:heavy metal translocating P-type ATPase [Sandaracinobacteroides sayramensis]|uniref:heavy metal translocating P-type ATPase n=1 Tax=Sandaracinobacteroides sayramensis TaxID=2913411 RepID=UPI003AB957CE
MTEAQAGRRRLDLHVPGIHCAGCIRKVEGAVRALPGITHARVNFTTRRLSAEWEPEKLSAPDIVQAVETIGFEARPFAASDAAAGAPDPASRRLLKSMAVAGFAAMNIMLLSVSVWSGADGATRDLFHLISAGIALPTVAYAGQPFFASAWGALKHGRTNMDVPISIGVLLATAMSLYETFNSGPHAYFDGVTTLLFFLLIGRYLDSLMRDRARAGVATLLKQSARGALVRAPDGGTEYRPIEAVAPGMTILVAAGERVPVDGTVLEGASAIDRSLVTGESLPEPVAPGGELLAGTLNLDAPIAMKASRVGEQSFLAEVVRLMETAEQGRARYTRIADRAARFYAPAVHLTALVAAIGWLLAGAGWHQSIIIAIAVLIITCPCALGLAVPAVQVRAASVLMKRGLLVKDGSALERLAACDTAVFDKTGTLTLGRPVPAGQLPLGRGDLALAAGLAARSHHPLSRALIAAARAEGVTPTAIAEVRELPGLGLEADWAGERLRLGRLDWAGAEAGEGAESLAAADQLELAFRRGDAPPVRIPFTDPLRPDARAALDRLRAAGLEVRILSGDREEAVAAAARSLGVEHYSARQTPQGKLAAIDALAAEGRKLLVVGDGLNDAPMLAAGHASIAPASASDAGQTAADILFLSDSLMAVPQALETARRADRQIRQNLATAIVYNVFAVPIAVAGFVTPLIAAIAMSLSSIIVVGNALRLKAPE